MRRYSIHMWRCFERKTPSFFLQQRGLLRKKRTEIIESESGNRSGRTLAYQTYDEINISTNEKRKDESKNEKKKEYKKTEDGIEQTIEEVKKQLYKKYNHYEIESDPNNVYLYEKNYEQLNELNIHKMLLLGLQKMKVRELNEMQINSFLTIQKGKDVVINYPDGTGKTLAYLLPILNNLYFLHDFLETIILNAYEKKNKKSDSYSASNSTSTSGVGYFKRNTVAQNFKFNNTFDLYKDMNHFFLKYSHYKKNVLLDNDFRKGGKWKQPFNLLPPVLDDEEQKIYSVDAFERERATERNREKEKDKDKGKSESEKRDIWEKKRGKGRRGRTSKVTKTERNEEMEKHVKNTTSRGIMKGLNSDRIQKINLMNKLIEIIKLYKINISNLNSEQKNQKELQRLNRVLERVTDGHMESEIENRNVDEVSGITTDEAKNQTETIYRYLMLNPLQINKPVIIVTVNKDNINQIINSIRQIDVLNRVNIQTLSDVPYWEEEEEQQQQQQNEKEEWGGEETREEPDNNGKNFDLLNLEVHKVHTLKNAVLCEEKICWNFADIVITTPDSFLNSYRKEKSKRGDNTNIILPTIIIFDEIDMLFQNNAYRNTMMNIFQIIKKRPVIYNPHIFISEANIENINKSIENVLITPSNKKNGNDREPSLFGEAGKKQRFKKIEEEKHIRDKRGKNNQENSEPLIQLIYVSSTLPSVGNTTAGSMLTERFNNIVEIISKNNYKKFPNVYTQWIELNKDKIIHLYLNNQKRSNSLKDYAMSNKINEFENASYEHRLDLLIYILKRYYQQALTEESHLNLKNVENKKEKEINTSEKNNATIYKTVVFVNSIKDCIKIYTFLKKHKWPVLSFHKNLSLNTRIRNLYKFSNSDLCILITTDLISRGLNIKKVDHLINFHFPTDAITYVHRVEKLYKTEDYYNEYNASLFGTINPGNKRGKGKKLEKYLYTVAENKNEKRLIVTNLISTSNFLLANSIRNAEKENKSMLYLFSRKKSFKMKHKKKKDLNKQELYINIGQGNHEKMIEDEEYRDSQKEIYQTNPDELLHYSMNTNGPEAVEKMTCGRTYNDIKFSGSGCVEDAYFTAPFSILQDEDSDSDEEHMYATHKKTGKNWKRTAEPKCHNTGSDKDKNLSKGVGNFYQSTVISNFRSSLFQEENMLDAEKSQREKENSSLKKKCSNRNHGNNLQNINDLPKWNDVEFDHKKFVIERFKNKNCYLINEVKRGKLLLNNFENNDGEDDKELLF